MKARTALSPRLSSPGFSRKEAIMSADDEKREPFVQMGEAARQGRMVERLRERNRDYAARAGAKPVPDKQRTPAGGWKRQTWKFPREQAREKAKEFLAKYPRAAYWSEVESWRVLDGDIIEFTMRRLPTAD